MTTRTKRRTSTKKPPRPALRELAQRQKAIDKANERVAELEAESRAEAGKAGRATADLDEYYRQLGAGECEPDAERERKLKRAVRGADDELTTKPVANPRAAAGDPMAEAGEPYRLETVNRRIDGMLEGARGVLQQAEQEYDQFVRSRFDDVATELGAEGAALVKRYRAAWARLQKAEGEWRRLRDRWNPLIERSGLTHAFPHSPLGGESTMEPPVPKQLLNGERFERPGRRRKRRAA